MLSPRRSIAVVALAALAALPGCHGSDNLFRSEIRFLREDVVDLYTIAFQAGVSAFEGDFVRPEEVTDPADAGNGFTVTYDRPAEFRAGLGFGSGQARLSVREDGVLSPDPLSFSFDTTTASDVVVRYELRYDGETVGGRATHVDFDVTLSATRTGPATFSATYTVDGETSLSSTFCRLLTTFRAPGRPSAGIDDTFGDGSGVINDPGVYDLLDLDVDWFPDGFRAEGEVGCCAFFDEFIRYVEVL